MKIGETALKYLKRDVESEIYRRGEQYYVRGAVGSWSIDKGGSVTTITGKVRGSRKYETTLTLNDDVPHHVDAHCSCPYGYFCKHAIALARSVAQAPEAEVRHTSAQNTLTVPQRIMSKAFESNKYAIVLDRDLGYAPSFHLKNSLYTKTRVSSILEMAGVTRNESAAIEYIQNGNFSGKENSARPDLAEMLPLIQKSGIAVFLENGTSSKPATIDLSPPKIKGELVHEPVSMHSDPLRIRHDFYLVLDDEYKPRDYWDIRAGFHLASIHSSHLVREHRNSLELHQMTPRLSALIARARPNTHFTHDSSGARKIIVNRFEAKLSGDDIAHFSELAEDATWLLALCAPAPHVTQTPAPPSPQRVLEVQYDVRGETLRVIPLIDYGPDTIDVSDSLKISHSHNRLHLMRRGTFEHPDSHVITLKAGVLYASPIDEDAEIAWHKEITKHAGTIGFSKTLKCSAKGLRKIDAFIQAYWPALQAFAEKHSSKIRFSKDTIAFSREKFRADFTVDLKADNDWLFFDLDCYCGKDKITLETLRAWVKSGEAFLRREDGTIIEIENRAELERLLRLLESFRAREGGFEGSIRNAPELQYVMTCSEHYNTVRKKSFDVFMKEIATGKSVKKVTLPKHLAGVVRPYQKEGIEWMYFLRKYRFAGILADDMGLGKTLQTLAILSMENKKDMPSVVVCPKSLVWNWKNEAAKFTPELRVGVVDGSPLERARILEDAHQYDLLVVNYSAVKRDEALWADPKRKFNYVVLDEAQFIKNHSTKSAQIVKKFNAEYRLALTGTPLENNVSEIWSMFDFLMPGFLGSYERFADHFHRPIMEEGDALALQHLREKISYFMLRRTKSEVLTELPPKIEQTTECTLGTEQNVLYQEILASVRSEVFTTIETMGFKRSQIHILAGLTKLRQACNHPRLLTKDTTREYESAKLDLCLELIDEVAEGKRKVLVFSQFTSMLEIIAEALRKRGVQHVYLSGKTRDRQELVDRFNNDASITVFLISTKAGGTGLNLTSADTVIIFDPWWNPSVENQAADRAHRIGQKKTVNVYRLITKGTIEEKIQALQIKKKGLFDALINNSGETFKKLTWDDVRELFA